MGLFNRNKNSANQVNTLPDNSVLSMPSFSFGSKRFGDMYLWMILHIIMRGMQNVHFFSKNEEKNEVLDNILTFVETNITTILWQMWNYGYIVIGTNLSNKLYIPDDSEIKKDVDGRVTNFDFVFYSDTYKFVRKSDFDIIRENVNNIDTLKGAEIYLTEHLGALGILSGSTMPMQQQEKNNFLDNLKKNFGIRKNQWQILLFQNPVDFKQMTLPVKELEIANKIKDEIMAIAGYFNVPYDLIPFSGKSTYDNQEQAIISFYRNCISPLAEIVLSVIKYIVIHIPKLLIVSDNITFRIDNVAELKDDRSNVMEYQTKLVQLIKMLRDLDIDTTEFEKELK